MDDIKRNLQLWLGLTSYLIIFFVQKKYLGLFYPSRVSSKLTSTLLLSPAPEHSASLCWGPPSAPGVLKSVSLEDWGPGTGIFLELETHLLSSSSKTKSEKIRIRQNNCNSGTSNYIQFVVINDFANSNKIWSIFNENLFSSIVPGIPEIIIVNKAEKVVAFIDLISGEEMAKK